MLWTEARNPHLTVDNWGGPTSAWVRVWTTVENRRTSPTLPTCENTGFPQVHNPYNDNKKNSASS